MCECVNALVATASARFPFSAFRFFALSFILLFCHRINRIERIFCIKFCSAKRNGEFQRIGYRVSPLSAFRFPLSAFRSPFSAFRSPLSVLRFPFSVLRSHNPVPLTITLVLPCTSPILPPPKMLPKTLARPVSLTSVLVLTAAAFPPPKISRPTTA